MGTFRSQLKYSLKFFPSPREAKGSLYVHDWSNSVSDVAIKCTYLHFFSFSLRRNVNPVVASVPLEIYFFALACTVRLSSNYAHTRTYCLISTGLSSVHLPHSPPHAFFHLLVHTLTCALLPIPSLCQTTGHVNM